MERIPEIWPQTREENDRDGGGTGYLQHEFTDVLLRAVKWQLMKEKERETWGHHPKLIYAA